MSERDPERESYRRGDGRSRRTAHWRDEGDSGMQYGRSRSSRRNDLSERDEFDDEYGQRAGGYGGEYGQATSADYSGGYDTQRQAKRGGGRSGRYRDQEWDGNFGVYGGYGQRGYSAGGPSSEVGDEIYRDYGRYGRSGDRQDWGGDYGRAYQGGEQGYYGEPGRNYLTRGGRQQWGRHAGRGPKNYTRSDERIRDDINDRLTDDPHLDATEVEVKVSNCDVTLSGSVDSREAKRRAEDCAEAVSGVRNVQNNLRVQPQGEEETARSSRKSGARGEASG